MALRDSDRPKLWKAFHNGHNRSFALHARKLSRMIKAATRAGAFARCRPRTMRAVGGENPVKSTQVDPGLRHQGDKPRDEVQRLEYDMRGAISIRRFELVAHLAIAHQRQPLFRHRWPCNVAAQTFQFPAFVRPGCHTRMRAENPATLPTDATNGSLQSGRVCSVNTLRPACGPPAMRFVIEWPKS